MKSALILTGAGISANAGIPTFDDIPEMRDVLSLEFFNRYYDEFWNKVKSFERQLQNVKPTMAHQLLAEKEFEIITMNLDGLHSLAGSKNVIEVHGNMQKVDCINPNCKKEYPFEFVRNHSVCNECRSKLKPRIVLYGENSNQYKSAFEKLFTYAGKDFLIIGTSFKNEFPTKMQEQAQKLKCNVYIFNEDADEEILEYIMTNELRGF